MKTKDQIILDLMVENENLYRLLEKCQWYWPHSDMEYSFESAEEILSNENSINEVVRIERGGIVESRWYVRYRADGGSAFNNEYEIRSFDSEKAAQKYIDARFVSYWPTIGAYWDEALEIDDDEDNISLLVDMKMKDVSNSIKPSFVEEDEEDE